MDPLGKAQSQRALGADGSELEYSQRYQRSFSFREVVFSNRRNCPVTWTKREDASAGYMRFVRDDERGCVQTTRHLGMRFKGIFLEKSDATNGCSIKFEHSEEFYPALYKLLTRQLNWGTDFLFRGLASFIPCLMEWTEYILYKHEAMLRKADIYGLVAVSRFPYTCHPDVWRAFCELWGPLTNTLHHGGGELGISLYDLKVISGLPILGEPYEEFLPPNSQLLDDSKFSPTVLELLRIHADLCRHLDKDTISWWEWLDHFFRGKKGYDAFGEDFYATGQGRNFKPKKHAGEDDGLFSKRLALTASIEGKFAAFLSLMLCRFVFPHGHAIIRPETFVMACLMAKGIQVSLAPAVLGHICFGLNEMATHPTHPGRANPNFGIHFVIGWLGEYFPCLYRRHPDDEFPDHPRLVRYAGLNGNAHNIHQARLVLRHSAYVNYRAVSFSNEVPIDRVDVEGVLASAFEELLCIRSAVLPVRVGRILSLQPYYPNRFSRQFGFDQGVPTNSMVFFNPLRSGWSLTDIASCYSRFFLRNTGAAYTIPASVNQGICTTNYCSWWVSASTPYLSQSIKKVNITLTKRQVQLRDNIFVIDDAVRIIHGLKIYVKTITAEKSFSSGDSFVQQPASLSVYERHSEEKLPAEDIHFNLSSNGSPIRQPISSATPKKRREEWSSDDNDDAYFKRVRRNRYSESPDSQRNKTNFSCNLGSFPDVVTANDLEDFEKSDSGKEVDHTQISEPIFLGSNVDRSQSLSEVSDVCSNLNIGGETSAEIDFKPLILPEADFVGTKNDTPDVVSLKVASTPLQAFSSAPVKEHVRHVVLVHLKGIVDTISKAQDMLVVRDEVHTDLATFRLLAKAAKIDEPTLSWLESEIEKLLDGVGVVAALVGVVDEPTVQKLSTDVSLCKNELKSKEERLLVLLEKSDVIKGKEKGILRERELLKQREEELAVDKENLKKKIDELKECINHQTLKFESMEEAEKLSQAQLHKLRLQERCVKEATANLTSFAFIKQ